MEIQYVKEFIELTKHGNYLIAAEELYISQSSLSKHIMALEKELGASLFNRTTRRVHLTPIGNVFLPYAQQIIDADAKFHNVLAVMKKDAKDSLRLGVLPAFTSYGIENAVLEYKRKCPQFPIFLEEGTNEGLLQMLKDGTCNIALVRTFEESFPPEFSSVPLLNDYIALITTPGSVFDDGRDCIPWKELEQGELLSSTSQLQADMLTVFSERAGIHLNIISRLSRAPSIIDMLRKGIGDAALLNKIVSQQYKGEMSFKIIDLDPPLYSTVSLVYLKNQPMTPVMRSFINTAITYTAKGVYSNVQI